MAKENFQDILSLGKAEKVTVDPNFKTDITRRQIDTLIKDIKTHLANRKKVHILIVKE